MLPTLPLSLALLGLTREGLRAQLEWVASLGYRAVQLNATATDCRPRDLGRSARRDLAALLRRLELVSSGVDLFVPADHFIKPEYADRATSAVVETCGFTADMASLAGGQATLSVELPSGDEARDVVRQLTERAATLGVRLADHAWPATWGLAGDQRSAPIGVGLDPAAVLLAGDDPAQQASRLGARLASVRLSDITAAGRVEPGKGRLDVLAYTVSVVTSGFPGYGIVDLRALKDQERIAAAVRAAVDPRTE